ncbi:MAG: hypothetical protein RLP44_07015 [Aggregatilineales bacterium]
MPEEIDPISAQDARVILESAIEERLGANWKHDPEGWIMVSGHDYMARFTKGDKRIDFQVDLLGNINIDEQDAGPEVYNGQLIAWMILVGSLLVALIIARIAGFL